jgi:hypothetical protein
MQLGLDCDVFMESVDSSSSILTHSFYIADLNLYVTKGNKN